MLTVFHYLYCAQMYLYFTKFRWNRKSRLLLVGEKKAVWRVPLIVRDEPFSYISQKGLKIAPMQKQISRHLGNFF